MLFATIASYPQILQPVSARDFVTSIPLSPFNAANR